jgi:hypothetical protein
MADNPLVKSPIEQLHSQIKARYQHIGKVETHLNSVSSELDKLTEMGDSITEADVINGAGKLVGSGNVSAQEMAGILADMPQQGGPMTLASWVSQHDAAVKKQQFQLSQVKDQARHALGVSAHRVIAAALGGQLGRNGVNPGGGRAVSAATGTSGGNPLSAGSGAETMNLESMPPQGSA